MKAKSFINTSICCIVIMLFHFWSMNNGNWILHKLRVHLHSWWQSSFECGFLWKGQLHLVSCCYIVLSVGYMNIMLAENNWYRKWNIQTSLLVSQESCDEPHSFLSLSFSCASHLPGSFDSSYTIPVVPSKRSIMRRWLLSCCTWNHKS